jgi:hypothetical protein
MAFSSMITVAEVERWEERSRHDLPPSIIARNRHAAAELEQMRASSGTAEVSPSGHYSPGKAQGTRMVEPRMAADHALALLVPEHGIPPDQTVDSVEFDVSANGAGKLRRGAVGGSWDVTSIEEGDIADWISRVGDAPQAGQKRTFSKRFSDGVVGFGSKVKRKVGWLLGGRDSGYWSPEEPLVGKDRSPASSTAVIDGVMDDDAEFEEESEERCSSLEDKQPLMTMTEGQEEICDKLAAEYDHRMNVAECAFPPLERTEPSQDAAWASEESIRNSKMLSKLARRKTGSPSKHKNQRGSSDASNDEDSPLLPPNISEADRRTNELPTTPSPSEGLTTMPSSPEWSDADSLYDAYPVDEAAQIDEPPTDVTNYAMINHGSRLERQAVSAFIKTRLAILKRSGQVSDSYRTKYFNQILGNVTADEDQERASLAHLRFVEWEAEELATAFRDFQQMRQEQHSDSDSSTWSSILNEALDAI